MNVGSIAEQIQNRVPDIPLSLSGATLINIVDMQRIFAEQFIGETIGSIAIAEVYQPSLLDLATANLLKFMELEGVDVSSIKLGDLTVSKGATSSTVVTSEQFRDMGLEKLQEVGHHNRMFQAL